MHTSHPVRRTAAAALALSLLLQGGLSRADDTEMYFAQFSSEVKPNVFFILDDSASMKYCLDNQKSCKRKDITRIDVLKDTMQNLLKDMNGVNVGLMTLSRRQSLPVEDIATNRAAAIQAVQDLKARGTTPVTRALYRAARYFNAFPGTHDSEDAIKKKVPSPIVNECQPSHLVLLSDGQANKNTRRIVKDIQNLIGVAECDVRGTRRLSRLPGETCAVDLAQWMQETDQSPLEGMQNVTTHAIGFALDADPKNKDSIKKFLKDLASAGGGNAYTANTAHELTEAFGDIIKKAVQLKNTNLVNPAASGGDFLSNENKKQIYYSLFEPRETDRWPGNLKRYGLQVINNKPAPVSRDGTPALDNSGKIRETAQSWWGTDRDGNDVKKGGAAWQLPPPDQRNLYVSLRGDMQKLESANDNITHALLGVQEDWERTDLLDYIRGLDAKGLPRQALGAPLHSAVTTFAYQCAGTVDPASGKCNEASDTENPTQMAIIGTNEGFVQMFDTHTGIEQFAFMPEELLKNIQPLFDDYRTGSRSPIYGMDNTVTVWVNDKNKNGQVDGTDTVYAYATMRRGGNSLYALDITHPQKPGLLWSIRAGDSGFERLGQSWSQPVKTRVKIENELTDVLIFGGGYDPQQDEPAHYGQPGQGNDIYIVHAESGEKIWSASSDPGFAQMIHSIPAMPSVISLTDSGEAQPEGLATQVFIPDVGGKIWRLFLQNGQPKDKLVRAGGENNNGLFADFSGTAGDASNARRFYHAAEVAVGTVDGQKKLFVSIGSGYRAHPLYTGTINRIYSLHVPLQDNNKTLFEADLYPIPPSEDAAVVNAALQSGKDGWYRTLRTAPGEKLISTPKTVKGRLFFNTYIPPSAGSDPCHSSPGINQTYAVEAESGTRLPGQPSAIIAKREGVALGSPNLVCFDGKCWVQFGAGEFSDPFSRLGDGRKTWWMDL